MLKTLPRDDIKTEITTITPEIAEAYLSKNTGNRKLSYSTVNSYARDMAAGKWLLNGDAIRFDVNGDLIDGQHRLAACIKAESNFQSLVIYNLAHAAQDTIDGNRPRRASDILTINGFISGNLRAAALRLIGGIKLGLDNPLAFRATTQEILAANKRHPELAKSFWVQKPTIPVRGSMLVVTHYIGSHILDNPASATDFAEVFITGKPAYKDDPALITRERFMQAKLKGHEMTRTMQWNMLVAAWNKFRKGDKVKVLNKKIETTPFDDLDIRKL
jgi:hypothetical protein